MTRQEKPLDEMWRGFGGRLTARLGEIGMTQRELAVRLKVSEPTISRYIAGTRAPRAQHLNELATILGTSVDYLLGADK